MKLTPFEIELRKIMIDPYNPRFVNEKKMSQESLVSDMLQSAQSKELLKSMKQDIKWVNRIVLQKVFVTLVLCLRYLGTMSSLPWHKTPFIPFFHVVFAFLIILTILTSPTLPFGVEWGCYNSINRRNSLSINELFH